MKHFFTLICHFDFYDMYFNFLPVSLISRKGDDDRFGTKR
jgi:hypothetical protein